MGFHNSRLRRLLSASMALSAAAAAENSPVAAATEAALAAGAAEAASAAAAAAAALLKEANLPETTFSLGYCLLLLLRAVQKGVNNGDAQELHTHIRRLDHSVAAVSAADGAEL